MRKPMLSFSGALLSIVLGCSDYSRNYFPPSQETAKQEKLTLEQELFKDAKDGKIDMPFVRAALIASGCEEFMMGYYETKLRELTGEIADKTSGRSGLDRAKAIAAEIHKRVKYRINECRLNYLANSGIRTGNCHSESMLFKMVCERPEVKIKAGFMSHFTHIFPYVDIDGKRYYLDCTDNENDFMAHKIHLDDEFLHEAGTEEVVSDIYGTRACLAEMDGEEAEKVREIHMKGLSIFPKNQIILNDLVGLYKHSDYEKAVWALDLYIKADPKAASLYCHKARLLAKMSRYNEAISTMDIAISLFPGDIELKEMRQEIADDAKPTLTKVPATSSAKQE